MATDRPAEPDPEFLAMLRAHDRVVEASDADVELPPGVTHVLVTSPGQPPRLIERRKSAF